MHTEAAGGRQEWIIEGEHFSWKQQQSLEQFFRCSFGRFGLASLFLFDKSLNKPPPDWG